MSSAALALALIRIAYWQKKLHKHKHKVTKIKKGMTKFETN